MLCLIVAVASAVATRYYLPRVETKTIETVKEVVKTDVKTVIHTVTAPNGATDTTTTITDHSVKSEVDNKTSIVNLKPDWLASGTVKSNLKLETPIYGVHVSRRILGPAFIGAGLDTKGEVTLSLGLEF